MESYNTSRNQIQFHVSAIFLNTITQAQLEENT